MLTVVADGGEDPLVLGEHVTGVVERVHHESEEDLRAEWVRVELELGDDAEVAATTTEPPEQLRVGRTVHVQHVPTCRHELCANEVVAREPPLAAHPPETAAQGQPGDPGLADDARRHDEAVRLCRRVEIAERRSASDANTPGRPDRR